MKVYRDISEFNRLSNAVVTSGTFDGVHLGHRKILSRVSEIAKQSQGETVVLTYWPHPRMVLHPENHQLQLLTSLPEKIDLLSGLGIDHLLILPFTKEFSETSSEDFIRNLLVKGIGTKKLVIGYDHRFGKNREGSFENLKSNGAQYGFEVEEIPRQDIEDEVISSTAIRKALSEGDLATAYSFLGYPYKLTGTVVKGKQLGRTIGYPTANISVTEKYKLIPADGIYAVTVRLNNQPYTGMMSIGFNPTVDGKTKTIEVYIFDFNQEIYGQEIEIGFIEFLRKEEKFDGLETLKKQLEEDERRSRKILNGKI